MAFTEVGTQQVPGQGLGTRLPQPARPAPEGGALHQRPLPGPFPEGAPQHHTCCHSLTACPHQTGLPPAPTRPARPRDSHLRSATSPPPLQRKQQGPPWRPLSAPPPPPAKVSELSWASKALTTSRSCGCSALRVPPTPTSEAFCPLLCSTL